MKTNIENIEKKEIKDIKQIHKNMYFIPTKDVKSIYNNNIDQFNKRLDLVVKKLNAGELNENLNNKNRKDCTEEEKEELIKLKSFGIVGELCAEHLFPDLHQNRLSIGVKDLIDKDGNGYEVKSINVNKNSGGKTLVFGNYKIKWKKIIKDKYIEEYEDLCCDGIKNENDWIRENPHKLCWYSKIYKEYNSHLYLEEDLVYLDENKNIKDTTLTITGLLEHYKAYIQEKQFIKYVNVREKMFFIFVFNFNNGFLVIRSDINMKDITREVIENSRPISKEDINKNNIENIETRKDEVGNDIKYVNKNNVVFYYKSILTSYHSGLHFLIE